VPGVSIQKLLVEPLADIAAVDQENHFFGEYLANRQYDVFAVRTGHKLVCGVQTSLAMDIAASFRFIKPLRSERTIIVVARIPDLVEHVGRPGRRGPVRAR